jgi:hypothetical protein
MNAKNERIRTDSKAPSTNPISTRETKGEVAEVTSDELKRVEGGHGAIRLLTPPPVMT